MSSSVTQMPVKVPPPALAVKLLDCVVEVRVVATKGFVVLVVQGIDSYGQGSASMQSEASPFQTSLKPKCCDQVKCLMCPGDMSLSGC